MTLSRDHWTTIMDGFCSGVVRRLRLFCIDFGALVDDAFLVIADCRGLQTLEVERSVVPSDFASDGLIRASVAKGLLRLRLWFLKSNSDAPYTFSDGAILDFFFRADVAPAGQSLSLVLEGTGLTDRFVTKFFEVSA